MVRGKGKLRGKAVNTRKGKNTGNRKNTKQGKITRNEKIFPGRERQRQGKDQERGNYKDRERTGKGAGKEERQGHTLKQIYEIPGFVMTTPSWDWDWVNYSRPGRIW